MNSLFINLNDPTIFQSFGGEECWGKIEAAAGDFILKEGEESQDFYYIFSGSVKITKSLKDAQQTQKHLATLSSGDFFGEGALLSDKSRGASVKALVPTILLKLPQSKFEELVIKDSQAAVGIILGIVRVLNARLQNMDERFVALQRVTHFIHQYSGSTIELIPLIFKEIAPVTHHGVFGLYSVDGQLRWQSDNATSEQLKLWSENMPSVLSQMAAPKAPEFIQKDSELYVGVQVMNSGLRGVLTAQLCSECQERDLYLLLTIAEQMAVTLHVYKLGAKT